MTAGRTTAVALAAVVAFAVGVYAGLFLILATVDFGRPFETRFVVATVGIGTTLAIAAAGTVAPGSRAWGRIALAGGITGTIAVLLLAVIEWDAAALVPTGVAVAAAVTVAARSAED